LMARKETRGTRRSWPTFSYARGGHPRSLALRWTFIWPQAL